MLGSLARGDPGRRYFFLLALLARATRVFLVCMQIVRLRGDTRVEMRTQARQALRVHCGCLSGGETMPVDGVWNATGRER